jgi:acetolactate synthase-1/2/3 large subunit
MAPVFPCKAAVSWWSRHCARMASDGLQRRRRGYLEVLDALYDAPEIRLITCRQEGGAAFMAETRQADRQARRLDGDAWAGRLLDRRTPFRTDADGRAGRPIGAPRSTAAFRRSISARCTRAKWVTQIDLAERVPAMNQAFQVATCGGPVIVALPEDMLRDQRAAAVVGPTARCGPSPPISPRCAGCSPPPSGDHAGRRQRLNVPPPTSPALRWPTGAGVLLVSPPGHRRQPPLLLCRRSRHRRGSSLVARIKAADLVLAVGARIGEITSQGYTLLGARPRQVLIHVRPPPEARPVFRLTRAISPMPEFAAAAAALSGGDAALAGRWAGRKADRMRRGLCRRRWGGPRLGRIMSCASGCPMTRSSPAMPAISAAAQPPATCRPGRQLGPASGAMATAPGDDGHRQAGIRRVVVGFAAMAAS